MRWFYSPNAVHVHLLCLGGIGIFLFALLTGDKTRPASEYKWVLLFFAVAYPTLLFLLWVQDRLARRDREREAQQPSPAAKIRRERLLWRRASLVGICAAGGCFIYMGLDGWLIDLFPAHYLGFFTIALAILGWAGINIWYGGPIDPRIDPKPDNEDDSIGSA